MKFTTTKSIVAAAMVAVGITALAATDVPYRAWNEKTRQMEENVCADYTVVTEDTAMFEDGKWYVVTGEVECVTITVNGTAHLILTDGPKLTANGGIRVTQGNAINIYAQSEGVEMGMLDANGDDYCAGIGGGNGQANGTVAIHGGMVTATGGDSAAGIGGGFKGGVGVIAIYGGIVTASTPGSGAGIGGGQQGAGGVITISGGSVMATCNQSGSGIGGGYMGSAGTIKISGGTVNAGTYGPTSSIGGAGIGSGSERGGDTIIITGGFVMATGCGGGAGIGGGYKCSGGTITISGGMVTAIAPGSGAGIGGGQQGAGGVITVSGGTVWAASTDGPDIGPGEEGDDGEVTIIGGSVILQDDVVSPWPKNVGGDDVWCVTVPDVTATAPAAIKGLAGYGTRDIFDVDGEVCLWLPNDDYEFTVGEKVYAGTVEGGNTTAAEVLPEVTINEVKSGDPWDSTKGTITVDYSLAHIVATKEYKVAVDITANGQAAGVTNDAAKLVAGQQEVVTIDTVSLFGKAVVDAEAKVKVSLIAVEMPSVQLWEGGPRFATCNLGAEKPEEFGDLYDFDTAQTAVSAPWRVPTVEDFTNLLNNCDGEWETSRDGAGADIVGYRFTGKDSYASNSIFLPTAGHGDYWSRFQTGELGLYWTSTPEEMIWAYFFYLNFGNGRVDVGIDMRTEGSSIRLVRDTAEDEAVASAGAGFVLGPWPEGSDENPWKIGTEGHEDEVTAWTNGVGGLIVEGSGEIGSMPWAKSPAGITKLVKAEGVAGLEELVGSLPELTAVNGLTRGDFGNAIRGFVKADGFSAIEIESGRAFLDVVIGRSDSLDDSAVWSPVSTNTVEVPAPGEQGFFIVTPTF